MAVSDSLFLFEVVVEEIKSLVEAKEMVVRADFADVFSLDLKDPKSLNIVMPEPPPLPPEPPGKKGKKAKKPPKPKKGKKGAVEPPPPPEPIIQSGQSILFATSAEILLAVMKKNPLQLSLWNKEDNLKVIGSANVTWDHEYLNFLNKICNCEKPTPLTVKGQYNIFNERNAKLIATVTIQIKLSYLEDKISSMFRSVPNSSPQDAGKQKCLYTGIHSRATSYMCSMKFSETIDADTPAPARIESTFVKRTSETPAEIRYADYRNAPGTNTTFFNEDGENCCIGKADKPPESIYKAPNVMPDLDFVADYVRKTIRSVNENLRMLTPRPDIKPIHRATDIDRLCGCHRDWPEGPLAERMKTDPITLAPCALCSVGAEKQKKQNTFEIHNIRGPCGKTDCRVAKKLKNYIEGLAIEDNKEVDINEIVGPCGSRTCTLANRIQQFIRKEGAFSSGRTAEGLSTVCACEDRLKESLKQNECSSDCTEDCDPTEEDGNCSSPSCPSYKAKDNIYCVNYCTVVNNFNVETTKNDDDDESDVDRYKHCRMDCPSAAASLETKGCTRTRCHTPASVSFVPCKPSEACVDTCGKDNYESAEDSDVEINLEDIHNPCCVDTCDVADKVKEFIIDGAFEPKKLTTVDPDDPCYCDCECKFGFTKKTTYCPVCGGYEVAGTDLKDKPPYAMPVPPCPIYHKLYDKNKFKLNSGLSTPESKHKKGSEDGFKTTSLNHRSSKIQDMQLNAGLAGSKPLEKGAAQNQPVTAVKSPGQSGTKDNGGGEKKTADKKTKGKELMIESNQEQKKKIGKFTMNSKGGRSRAVPKQMGWLWTSKSVPGLKFRPEWKPGAANRHVVKMLKHNKNPEVALAKKRKREMARAAKSKRFEKKPLLVVSKKAGEYTVTMETMKAYAKPRTINQYPYEEKAPETFFVGRTDEENAARLKRQRRQQRRKEREERRYIQQTFRNMCEDICMKTYRQAIGIMKNDENPECPCYPDKPDIISLNANLSCSCSDDYSSSGSETDNDEWTLEFTPPIATYDIKFKPAGGAKNHVATQYTYLDYRVKLFDRHGNPVARYFKGPDGKEQCSDLGGFWSPSGHWLEINTDGYIGPDLRWVPNTFIGPDGQVYDSAEGKFQGPDGKWRVIGVDGYIDGRTNKWVSATKRRGYSGVSTPRQQRPKSDSSWSCFGDVTPTVLAERGIVGHGHDKKALLKKLKDLQEAGEEVTFPKTQRVPKSPYRPKTPPKKRDWTQRYKCRHPIPSIKGVLSVDSEGNRTYFTLDSGTNMRPEHRIKSLQKQGISVTSYHVPCHDSFMGPEDIKKKRNKRHVRTDTSGIPVMHTEIVMYR